MNFGDITFLILTILLTLSIIGFVVFYILYTKKQNELEQQTRQNNLNLLKQQNELELNAQKISLFDKRYDIYLILSKIITSSNILLGDDIFENISIYLANKYQAFRNLILDNTYDGLPHEINKLDKLVYQKFNDKQEVEQELIDSLKAQVLIFTNKTISSELEKLKSSKFLFSDLVSNHIINLANAYETFLLKCVNYQIDFSDEKTLKANEKNFLAVINVVSNSNFLQVIENTLIV